MNDNDWIHSNCWLACFDILGFKELVSFQDGESLKAEEIKYKYEEAIKHLEDIDYCWFSDTFLMFTRDATQKSCFIIECAVKAFIYDCIHSHIPLRGAISVGNFTRSKDNRVFMGEAFCEAFEYAEDQDWLGLIVTPSAITKAKSFELNPIELDHNFIYLKSTPLNKTKKESYNSSEQNPMRKYSDQNVMAYRLDNGAANFESPLLSMLKDMKSQAPVDCQGKYERTIKFIEKHYKWI